MQKGELPRKGAQQMNVYERLEALGRALPPPPVPGGLYKPALQIGDLVYVSGQGSMVRDGDRYTGRVGADRTVEDGQKAAQMCVMNALRILHDSLGDLNRIQRVVKVLGFVSSADGFFQQPKVIDGASQLLADLFGEDPGVGVRSAISTNQLPLDLTVEIEFLFQLKPETP